MALYLIKEISNGWTLKGANKTKDGYSTGPQEELFLPSIHAVADILETWQLMGFAKAAVLAEKKYGGK